MEKYELDAVLENYFAPEDKGPEGPPPPPPPPSQKKKVKFNDNVEIQWPDDAERLRQEASRFIAKRKQERETKLLTLVYQMEGRHRGKSDEDPGHPNFPFPLDYKPIDFDQLDPYKLYQAAEYLRQEQRKLEEPFFLHTKKLKSVETKADEVHEMELDRIQAIRVSRPQTFTNKVRRPTSARPLTAYAFSFPYSPASKAGDGGKKAPSFVGSRSTLIFAQMNNPGGKLKREPGYYPKPPVTKVPPRPREGTDALTMHNVAVWIKSNFNIKPVPLLLHPPNQGGPGPQASMISNLPFEPSRFSINPPPPPPHPEPRELHILNGLVMGRNAFNETVGNCFDQNYDTSGFKDSDDYTQKWVPHRFRCAVRMKDFKDNEISVYFRRPFLIVKAECPRTTRRLGEKAEETIEIPDWVPVDHLKFFRLRDGTIIIEEAGRRKNLPPGKPDPEVLAALKRYFPYSI